MFVIPISAGGSDSNNMKKFSVITRSVAQKKKMDLIFKEGISLVNHIEMRLKVTIFNILIFKKI